MTDCTVDIEQYLGKNISDICNNSYHKDTDNHCAHFVSHVLGFRFGFKCRDMTGEGTADDSANIRVHQVFAKCPKVGTWDDKPVGTTFCLAFITSASNVNLKTKQMRNHPRKHIGIFHGGKIYHYSNRKNKVVAQTPSIYAKHYSGNDITVYYGSMPKLDTDP